MRILTVVGARPQFIKAAPVSALLRTSHTEILVHTGQHHDASMSDVFFEELGLPAPDHHLGIAGLPHGAMVGRMLEGIEALLPSVAPDRVLVYGDTNSTLAAALAASQRSVPLAHVEAGLRSFDRRMPEEFNRVLTDLAADLLFCPSATAVANLAAEGITRGVHLVGDVMHDGLLAAAARAREKPGLLGRLGVEPGRFILATIHRAENTDDATRLRGIVDGLNALDEPVLLPLHPRTRDAIARAGLRFGPRVTVTEPLGYLSMAAAQSAARSIVTDSGGVQKEAYWLGVPCLTVRDNTEWVETVEAGWNRLVPATREGIVAAVRDATRPAQRPPLYDAAGAAARIVSLLG